MLCARTNHWAQPESKKGNINECIPPSEMKFCLQHAQTNVQPMLMAWKPIQFIHINAHNRAYSYFVEITNLNFRQYFNFN